ncbi:acyltransferase family protein, partial [Nonomuraea sp. NPDC004297]
VLPAGALSRGLGGDAVVLGVIVVLALGLAAILAGGRNVRRCGAIAVAVLALALLAVNSRVGAWQSLAILATMFAGTALYRLDQGQVRRTAVRWLVGLVPVVSIAAAVWFGPGWGMTDEQALAFRWSWSTAVAVAWLTFLACRLLRSAGFPRLLVSLGLVSYSVYLLHPLAIQVLRRLLPYPVEVPPAGRIACSVLVLAVVVAVSVLSYRYVERPAQGLGRRLSRAAVARVTP